MIITLGYGFFCLVADAIWWEWKAGFWTMFIDSILMWIFGYTQS